MLFSVRPHQRKLASGLEKITTLPFEAKTVLIINLVCLTHFFSKTTLNSFTKLTIFTPCQFYLVRSEVMFLFSNLGLLGTNIIQLSSRRLCT